MAGWAVTQFTAVKNTTGATLIITSPGTIPIGSLVVVGAGDGSTTVGTLADSAGNSWTKINSASPNASTANGTVSLWYSVLTVAMTVSSTITYTKGTSGNACIVDAIWASGNAAVATVLDSSVTNSATGSSTTLAVQGGNGSAAGNLLVAFATRNGASTYTVTDTTDGWNNSLDATGTTSLDPSNVAGGGGVYQILGAAVTTTPNYSVTVSSNPWAALVAGFKLLNPPIVRRPLKTYLRR